MRQEFPSLKQTLISSEVLLQLLAAPVPPSPAAPVPSSWALGAPSAPQDHVRDLTQGGHCPAMAFAEEAPEKPLGVTFSGCHGLLLPLFTCIWGSW